MSNRKIIVKEIKLDSTTIEVNVFYNLGGYNYFTGTNEKRGFYLSITPVKKSNGFRSYTAFSGVKKLLKETARFSKSGLDKCSKNLNNELVNELVQHVINKNNL